jgi:predicted nuclease with RNAse H fold
VVGVDVGGCRKGFHAVALTGTTFRKQAFADPADVVRWCREAGAAAVGVDAPCGWSVSGKSRQAERTLRVNDENVHCFATPSERHARASRTDFYGWVFNGGALYAALKPSYPLYDGAAPAGRRCFETFPQAIACALAGRKVSTKCKAAVRRNILGDLGYDHRPLTNVDFIDAALCAVAAERFLRGAFVAFGQTDEGFIVIPS